MFCLACIIYGENETLFRIKYETISVSPSAPSIVPFSFTDLQGQARKIGLYTFEKNSKGLLGSLMQIPCVIE